VATLRVQCDIALSREIRRVYEEDFKGDKNLVHAMLSAWVDQSTDAGTPSLKDNSSQQLISACAPANTAP
jgi:hypothetical protein